MKKTCNKAVSFSLLLLSLLIVASCSSSRKLRYFQDMPQVESGAEFQTIKFEETKIQAEDILNIRVNTVDQEASAAINEGNSAMSASNRAISNSVNNQMISGYVVDQAGTVELPILGRIAVAGSTLSEAKEKIREAANEYYKDATISVRFSNFRVSVLGEVSRPGIFVIPNQRVSILDAISFSGDISVYGKRNNVMLIRKDEQGSAVAVKLDLTSKEIFNSPFFYLRQNDVVYVEPARAKLLNADNSIIRYAGLLISLTSLGILIFR